MSVNKDRFHDLLADLADKPPGNRNLVHPVYEVKTYYELLEDAGFIVCDFGRSSPVVRVTAAGYAVVQAAADRGANAFDVYVERLFGPARA